MCLSEVGKSASHMFLFDGTNFIKRLIDAGWKVTDAEESGVMLREENCVVFLRWDEGRRKNYENVQYFGGKVKEKWRGKSKEKGAGWWDFLLFNRNFLSDVRKEKSGKRKEFKLESEYMGEEKNGEEHTQKREGKWEKYGCSNVERRERGKLWGKISGGQKRENKPEGNEFRKSEKNTAVKIKKI